ncbi:MAG: Ig-like domain-containing protein [Myxococcota bacterium]
MRVLVLWLAVLGCTGAETRQLVLDGPPTLTIDRLGPVEGPAVLLSDGSIPEGVTITAVRADVASVEGGAVTAVGPGESVIEARWQEQRVTWTLVVDPKVSLQLISPPATLSVGQTQPLHLQAKMAGRSVDPGNVVWTSTSPEVMTVSAAGEAVGVSVGTAYVIAERGGAEAMAEISVVAE